MPSYRVRFVKVICDATGHEHRTCQSTIEVVADNPELAARSASDLFAARFYGLNWRYYADGVEVEDLEPAAEFRSRRYG
jgi:hypothetical protein